MKLRVNWLDVAVSCVFVLAATYSWLRITHPPVIIKPVEAGSGFNGCCPCPPKNVDLWPHPMTSLTPTPGR